MKIYAYICILLSSLFLSQTVYASGNKKGEEVEPDTVPLYRGLSVSVDAVGPLTKLLGDYGQYEAALRLNLKDKYFPIIELGYGIGNHEEDAITGLKAETKAPYGRIGVDYNILKNKHDIYRLYAGVRYGFTSFKTSISNNRITDPVWGGGALYQISDETCNYHWGEGVFGVDVKIVGPFHLGWSVRYRLRLSSTDTQTGAIWYVPGYGVHDTSNWGGTFNLTLEI